MHEGLSEIRIDWVEIRSANLPISRKKIGTLLNKIKDSKATIPFKIKHPVHNIRTVDNKKTRTPCFSTLRFSRISPEGAHILDLRTIGFGTFGLGQLSISDNWPRAQLASQTIGSMKPRKKQKKCFI